MAVHNPPLPIVQVLHLLFIEGSLRQHQVINAATEQTLVVCGATEGHCLVVLRFSCL